MTRYISKYRKLLAFAFLIVALVSCGDEPDKILYKGPAFVFFESAEYVPLLESSSTTFKIPVRVSEPQNEDFTVGYDITPAGAISEIDYRILSPNPITIEAGEYTAYIEVEMIDNEVLDTETRAFDMSITDVSNSKLQKQVRTTLNLEVINDDCSAEIPKIVKWVGTVAIEDVGFASGSAAGAPGSGGSCGGVLILSGEDTFGLGVGGFEIRLVFTQDPVNPTTGTVEVAKDSYFQDENYSAYHYEATGIYNETTKEILLDYIFYDSDGSPAFSGQHYITVP